MFREIDRLAKNPSPSRVGVKNTSRQIKRKKRNSISSHENVYSESLSTDSSHHNKSTSSRQMSHSPFSSNDKDWKPTATRHQNPDTKITLQARQKRIAFELQKLSLQKEISVEEVGEKQLEEEPSSNGRLRDILKSKFGIGSAKNRHAATMNVVLRMRAKREEGQEEMIQYASSWMKTLINRVWILYKFSQIMKQHSSSLLEKSARMEAEDVLRSVEQRSAHRNESSSHTDQRIEGIPRLLVRSRSLLPPRYRQILNKYPQGRSDEDISEMRVFLRSSVPVFKQYSEGTQLALCRSMYYTFYEKGRVILRQGNQGKNFYIALSGSLVSMHSDIDVETGEVYTCDNVMKSGEKFGDIALRRKTKRTATVVCCEDSELLMIDKDLFDKFCPDLSEEQLKEKMAAVSNVSLFEGWNAVDLEDVLLEAQLQDFAINRVVVKDSLDSTLFFVVVEGKCRVLKEIDVVKMGWSHELCRRTSTRRHHLSELPPSQHSQLSPCDYRNDIYKRQNDSIPQMNGIITRDGKAYLQLRELGPGDIFELTEMYKTHLSKMGIRASKQNFLKPHSLMLVSDGAKLLQITKSKFKSKAGASFIETLPKYFIKYPSEEELARSYKAHVSWILYKKDVLCKELVNQKAHGMYRADKTRGFISGQLTA